MTLRSQLIFWATAFAAFVAFVVIFKSVLLPFVLGLAIAYFLNPLVNALGRDGLARGPAALLILFVFLVVVLAFFAVVLPVVFRELSQLIDDMPGYIDQVRSLIEPYVQKLLALIGKQDEADLKQFLNGQAGNAVNVTGRVLMGVLAGGQAVLDVLSLVLITPIVAFFMMKEWNHITAWVEGLMPQDSKQTIKDLLREIDTKLSGFVRGQISVAVILGLAYAIALSLLGLKYGFLIGMAAGLLSIIPMVGSTLGLLVSIAVAWFQAGEWTFVAMVAGVFLVGQIIEGNFLTPRLVGKSVGLHPLWVFFALLAGGSLFGILGMLLAVPVAAVAGVLLAFGIARYKSSAYYKGVSPNANKKTKKKKDDGKNGAATSA